MRRGAARVLAALLCALALAGCWDRREVEQLGLMTMAALDLTEDGQYRWTVEVPLPAQVGAPSLRQGGSAGQPTVLAQAVGPSPTAAERELVRTVAREPFWAHTTFFLIGERAARAGIRPFLDFTSRRYEVRQNSLIFVTRGDAGKFLANLRPILERTVGNELRDQSRTGRREAALGVDISQFLQRLGEDGFDPFAPVLVSRQLEDGTSPTTDGVALFQADRMVALLPDEARLGVFWIRGSVPIITITVPCPDPASQGRTLSGRFSESKGEVQVDAGGGRPQAAVRVEAKGELIEWNCLPTPTPENLAAAAEALGAVIRGHVEAALRGMREHRSDAVGFGAALHRHQPEAWREVSGRWRDVLAELPVSAEVKVRLERTGLTDSAP